jgi:hypothetical protein
MAHTVSPYAGRTQMLSGLDIVIGTDGSSGETCSSSFISLQDIPASSRAIVAHNHCTMPGPSMSYFPEERVAPM